MKNSKVNIRTLLGLIIVLAFNLQPVFAQQSGSGFRDFNFAIIADPHIMEPGKHGAEKISEAVKEINFIKPKPAFVLMLGDIGCYYKLNDFKTIISGFSVPCYFVLGNWEYKLTKAYKAKFATAKMPDYPLYYKFEYMNCLFIGLWDCTPAGGPKAQDHQGDMDDEQMGWLGRILEEADKKSPPYSHKFIFAHIPPRRDLKTDSMHMKQGLAEKFAALCDEYKVSACFFSHLHKKEEFSRGMTRFIVTPSLNWNVDGSRPGFGIVSVTEKSVNEKYIPIELPEILSQN